MTDNSAANENVRTRRPTISVALAETDEEIMRCQRLRYDIFANEMQAYIDTEIPGLDIDRFDRFCQHLMVINERSGEIIGTTRLLTSEDASRAGLYYSETQFNMSDIRLKLEGRFMEIGRTCIHRDYRNGATLAMLWQGIAKVIVDQDMDYLIGCASIPMDHGPAYIEAIMENLRSKYMAPDDIRVQPYISMPHHDIAYADRVILPPLLKGYLKQGAWICGEPFYDAAFNVADVFVVLKREHLASRYMRHFMKRANNECQTQTIAYAS